MCTFFWRHTSSFFSKLPVSKDSEPLLITKSPREVNVLGKKDDDLPNLTTTHTKISIFRWTLCVFSCIFLMISCHDSTLPQWARADVLAQLRAHDLPLVSRQRSWIGSTPPLDAIVTSMFITCLIGLIGDPWQTFGDTHLKARGFCVCVCV